MSQGWLDIRQGSRSIMEDVNAQDAPIGVSQENAEPQVQAQAQEADDTAQFEVVTDDMPVQAISDDAESKEPAKGDDSTATDKAEKPNRVQKRIDKVVKQREDARRKAEALERKIAELEGNKTLETQRDSSEAEAPSEDDYDTYSEYLDAVDEFESKQETQSKSEEKAESKSEENAQDAPELTDSEKTALAIFKEKIESAENLPKDFQEKIRSQDLNITGAMLEALALCDKPDKIAYHLATNPEIANEIASGSYAEQISAITALNLTTAKPKPVKLPQTDDPINPVGANYAAPQRDLSKMSFAEYEQNMNKSEQGRSGWK